MEKYDSKLEARPGQDLHRSHSESGCLYQEQWGRDLWLECRKVNSVTGDGGRQEIELEPRRWQSWRRDNFKRG